MPNQDDIREQLQKSREAHIKAIHVYYESVVEPEIHQIAKTLCLAYLEEHGGGDASALVSMFSVLPKGGMDRYLISMEVHPAWYDFVHMATVIHAKNR